MAAASTKVYGENVGDTKMEELRKWKAQTREAKIADLRARTDNMVAGDKADDQTLDALHQHLIEMGH